MDKKYVIGIDPGTASLSINLRDTTENNLFDQLEYTSDDIVRAGVIESGLNKYTSFAAERRAFRNTRARYRHRRSRKQTTLKLFLDEKILGASIKYPLCPLSKEDLEKWMRYDKAKGFLRKYPINAIEFIHWLMQDFNNDGKVDMNMNGEKYLSPYQLREELLTRQFDFTKKEDCYKLGRALYHMAQRRGFRSSKGGKVDSTTLDEELPVTTDSSEEENFDIMEYSEKRKAKTLHEYMADNGFQTVGCALAALERNGVRLRDSEYEVIRKDLKKEIEAIFNYQKQLSTDSYLYIHLVSEKKGEGTIFYQRPQMSQKGKVEKCTLEPLRKRCKVSHPEFEKYRAWSFINNIRVRLPEENEPHLLPLEIREALYDKISGIVSKSFEFISIRKIIEKKYGLKEDTLSWNDKTINYKDDYTASGCPSIGRLRKIFGDDWASWTLPIDIERKRTNKSKTSHKITYNAINLWQICTDAESETFVKEFATNKLNANRLNFSDEQIEELVRLFKNASDEYSNLSVCALQKINRFLIRGFNNYEATLLANVPTLIGEDQWQAHKEEIESRLQSIISENREQKRYINITNRLIADYLSLDEEDKCAEDKAHNDKYELQEDDINAVVEKIKDVIGKRAWELMATEEQEHIKSCVSNLYQQFFHSQERTYLKAPIDADCFRDYLLEKWGVKCNLRRNNLYIPYDYKYYPPATRTKDGYQLCSPVKGANRNPAAMRILYLLRRRINTLLKDKRFDITQENTRVVVELPREMNDANMRKAIDIRNRRREKENKLFKALISELQEDVKEQLPKVRLLIEQCPEYAEADFNEQYLDPKHQNSYNEKIEYAVTKYRLWLEQRCIDIYSGRIIPISALFDDNRYDIEHTVPRSIVLNDGLENKTITEAFYNRRVKGTLLPTELPNYENVILPNLRHWQERVKRLEERVEYWKKESKRAFDLERKDYCIVQRHLWQMELDYWNAKLEFFTISEIKADFVSKQLSDTRVISKYVFHYLKSFFHRVDMQYGCTTAIFRNIYGLPKKDRNRHTHHAIDAMMLSFIPTTAQRDKMMKLFFQIDEAKKTGRIADAQMLKRELEQEKNLCIYGYQPRHKQNVSLASLAQQLEDTILVNHVCRDQTLTLAKKKGRLKRHGESMDIVKTGNCIRGKIHGESFFGAITQWKVNDQRELIRDDNNSPIVDENHIKYVMRVPLKKGTGINGFVDWSDLEKRIVDKLLYKKLKEYSEGKSFGKACKDGFFVQRQVNGIAVQNQIRHVRCYVASNQGHVHVKPHIAPSKKNYKQWCYAGRGDLLYASEYRGEKEVKYVLYSISDITRHRAEGKEDILQAIVGNREVLHLTRVITTGEMVLLYNESPDELNTLDNREKNQRLYRIAGFEKNGKKVKLVKHFVAKIEDKEFRSCDNFNDRLKMLALKMSLNRLKFVTYMP